MHQIIINIQHQLGTLQLLLASLSESHYVRTSAHLYGATIGGHLRHMAEMIECLLNGYKEGLVCYDKRKRNMLLETSTEAASHFLEAIGQQLNVPNKPLLLEATVSDGHHTCITIVTSYERELLYNLEHIIHHMALIRVALNEFEIPLVNPQFGIAYTTQKHRQSCAQ
ncbi:MAG TPA: hypothetical protein PKD90_10495 [Phnomibacter sp.]|nr:hypothetical protein [Phnomibacter sp.]